MKRTIENVTDTTIITKEDMVVLKDQLSHVRNFSAPEKVLARCKWGFPQVSLVTNTKKKKDFIPGTLLWLTCPRINSLISTIESEKYTQELQVEIDEKTSSLQQDLLDSNVEFTKYIKENHLSKEEYALWISGNREKDPEKAVQIRFHNTGVSHPTSIKCLHGHTAAYLSGVKDQVAKRAFEKVNTRFDLNGDIEDIHLLDCPSDCIKCKK